MGTRGPAALPTALLKLGSSTLRRRKNEPPRLTDPPPMPKGLKGVAKQAWRVYEKLLTERGILSTTDGLALELLCRTYADLQELEVDVAEYGQTYQTNDGTTKIHPCVKLRNETRRDFVRLLNLFGMSPASQSNVSRRIPDPMDDEKSSFFNDDI